MRRRWFLPALWCLSLGLLSATNATAAPRAEECARQAEYGLELKDTGRFVAALSELRQCAVEECPKVVRDDCRSAMLDIREKAPRLFVRAREPSGADIVDATLSVDGEPLAAEDLARGRIVDPGVHVVRASTSADFAETKVLVVAADRERVIDLVIGHRPAVAPAKPRDASTRDRTLSFVLGGVGLGLLTTAGIVGATALSDYRELEGRCGSSCRADEVSSVQGRIIATDVLLGAGLVSIAAATVLWLVVPERHR